MRLYVDTQSQKLVLPNRYVQELTGINAKFGSTISFPVRFVQDGAVVELGEDLDIRLGAKTSLSAADYTVSNWDGSAYAFTKTGTGSATAYTVTIIFSGDDLESRFNASKTPVFLFFALKWIVGGEVLETATIPVVVDWDVNTLTEGQSTSPNPIWPDPSRILTIDNFHLIDLSGLPTSDPGSGRPWLNGGVPQVGP